MKFSSVLVASVGVSSAVAAPQAWWHRGRHHGHGSGHNSTVGGNRTSTNGGRGGRGGQGTLPSTNGTSTASEGSAPSVPSIAPVPSSGTGTGDSVASSPAVPSSSAAPAVPAAPAATGGASSSERPIYSDVWSGATVPGSGITDVSGTFTVPSVKLATGADASQDNTAIGWVSIDGYGQCRNVLLQTGIEFGINNGQSYWRAFYEWYPDQIKIYQDIQISEGDIITASVHADSTTSGVATIVNHSNGQTVNKTLTSTTPLCQSTANYIVEDYTNAQGQKVAFIDFGTFTFSNTSATAPNGASFDLSKAQPINLSENGGNTDVLATTQVTNGQVIITHT